MRKLLISLPTSFLLALGLNWNNHSSYNNTLYKVQTVDFNILANTLPTKLSFALRNKNQDEIQRTIDSNFGYFGLVVTDCASHEKQCPGENIIAKNRPERQGWKEKATIDKLSENQYDLLTSKLPMTARNRFENARSDTAETTTGIIPTGIIGRVYYIRKDPTDFWGSQLNWLNQPIKASLELFNGNTNKSWDELVYFFDGGPNKFFLLTYAGGILLGILFGKAWDFNDEKRKKLEDDIKNLNNENKKLLAKTQKLKEKVFSIKRNEEVSRNELSELQMLLNSYQDNIESKEQELVLIEKELKEKQLAIDKIRQNPEKKEIDTDVLKTLEQQMAVVLHREKDLKGILEDSFYEALQYKEKIVLKEAEVEQVSIDLESVNLKLRQADKQIQDLLHNQEDNKKLLMNIGIVSENKIAELEKRNRSKEQLSNNLIEEVDQENEKLKEDNSRLKEECSANITCIKRLREELENEAKLRNAYESYDFLVDLSTYTIAIIGGHTKSVARIAEELHRHRLGRNNFIAIPPSSEQNISESSMKKIKNCDLVVVVTNFIGHGSTTIIGNLKGKKSIKGEIIYTTKTSGATISMKILETIASKRSQPFL
jgi:hypothetical protein